MPQHMPPLPLQQEQQQQEQEEQEQEQQQFPDIHAFSSSSQVPDVLLQVPDECVLVALAMTFSIFSFQTTLTQLVLQ
jgi:hypothetical protein